MKNLKIFNEITDYNDWNVGAAWYLTEKKYQIPGHHVNYLTDEISPSDQKELSQTLLPLTKKINPIDMSPQLQALYHDQSIKPDLFEIDLLTLVQKVKPNDTDITYANKNKTAIARLLSNKDRILSWHFDLFGLFQNLKQKNNPDQLKQIRLVIWATK